MQILIIGGGGREHALAWKAAQSATVDTVFVAPGNAGTAREKKVQNVAINPDEIEALVAFARDKKIDLTIVGPETPLVGGIVDAFVLAGLMCFGPAQDAAVLEGSKAFAKDFLKRHRIPTADYRVFTDADAAHAYVSERGAPVVIKADGLAAGKGVVVAACGDEAHQAIDAMLEDARFGTAGQRIVIEDYLDGEEASFTVITDGEHVVPLASAQDHKARDDGDRGPNTGGMGAYSPAPVVSDTVHAAIMHDIVRPVINGMQAEGRCYQGFLYVGVMITQNGKPKVLEFNCRLGDPEAQVLLLRLKADLVALCLATLRGGLPATTMAWDERAALGVVLASADYPSAVKTGEAITGLDSRPPDDATKVFYAGATATDGVVRTTGGRVLCVTALGDTLRGAQQKAYAAAGDIHWRSMFYRKDIGHRALC